MEVISVAAGGRGETFPVYAFGVGAADGARAKVVVVDRPTKRIVCLPVSDGCARSCVFCASAPRPFVRVFSAGELEQMAGAVAAHSALPKTDAPILLSLMGVGEPLDSSQVMGFLRAVGGRFRTALATTVPSLRALALLMDKCPDTKITVSLHSGRRETRSAVLNNASCLSPRALYGALGDTVEYNYVAMQGVNDSPAEVRALNGIVGQGRMRLKLNTLNPWPGMPHSQGELPAHLLNGGIAVERYSTDGSSVFGACGQCGYQRGSVCP